MLLFDRDAALRQTLRDRLEHDGLRVIEATSPEETLERAGDLVSLVLIARYGAADDSLLQQLRTEDPDLGLLVLTGEPDLDAPRAPALVGFDHLAKPFGPATAAGYIARTLEVTRLRRELRRPRTGDASETLLGQSPGMQELIALVRRVAAGPAAVVLVSGEIGTGKDLVAHALHRQGPRRAAPFVAVDCASVPEPLLESELFGYERGAFTGANVRRRGAIERADGGTLLIDAIDALPGALQAPILALLEGRGIRRVGGTRTLTPDVRVVAATRTNLRRRVDERSFREDLFYRLAPLQVHLPPLRERTEDIPLLAAHFAERFARELRKGFAGITASAHARLAAHPWQGNVRELRCVMERAVLTATTDTLDVRHLALDPPTGGAPFRLPPEGIDMREVERDLLEQALARTEGNQTRAARLLGMNRDQIRYRIQKFALKD